MHYHWYIQRWHLDLAATAPFCVHFSSLLLLLLDGVWPLLTPSVVD